MMAVGSLLLALLIAVVTSARESFPTFPETHHSTCPEYCCCKACSDPDHSSYPYGPLVDGGLETVPSGGPVNPKLVDDKGLCQIPTWSKLEQVLYDHDNNASTPMIAWPSPPDTIWWTNPTVFGDNLPHVAPANCDCCRFSGIHNDCSYQAPAAARPTAFRIPNYRLVSGKYTRIYFYGGIEQSTKDYAELRNDTFCGYLDGINDPALRSEMIINTTGSVTNATETAWDIDSLPAPGCYAVCYYHAQLTTPTWYHMGYIDVFDFDDSPFINFSFVPEEVILEKKDVTFLINSGSPTWGFSMNDDVIELRNDGSCGNPSNVVLQSDSGNLLTRMVPPDGYDWCNPTVKPQVSKDRPLRFLAIHYSECPEGNRLPVPSIKWPITLPSYGVYDVCYKYSSSPTLWHWLGQLVVPKVQPLYDALMALYDATGGPSWRFQHGWGTATNPCTWYGVICDGKDVVTIALARNNLIGSIPTNFTDGTFTKVSVLNMERNALSGTIPHSIGHWTALRYLDLGYNQLSGTIPESLTNCPLRQLYLSDNPLTGVIPYNLRSLVNLRSIWVDNMKLAEPLQVPQPIKYLTPTSDPPRCPVDKFECPVTGERTVGVTQCGYDGITETSCLTIGCCWNAQDTTGKPCFTKKRVSYHRFPICTKVTCVEQAV